MRTVLDRKLRRDLLASRATITAILLVTVVGIATFVGYASAFVNLDRALGDYYATCRMADFWINVRKMPESAAREVEDLPGVAEVRTRIVFDAVVDIEHVVKPLSGMVISLPDTPQPVINNIILQRGGYFTDDRLEQVIVNDAFARARGINPGDDIALILNNRREELQVVGTAISSEFVYLIDPGSIIPDPANYGVFYVKQRFAAETLDFDGAANDVVGLLTPDARARPAATLDRIDRHLREYGVLATTPRDQQIAHRFITDELAGLKVTAITLPAIFLGVAALILNILMSRLAEQQRTTVGTLKALGFGTGVLAWHYIKFGLLVGVLGAVLGAASGYGLAHGMLVIYRRYYEFPRLEGDVIPAVLVSALGVGVLFALLGTVQGVRSVVRLQPAEAMRAKPPVEGGAIPLERFRGLWRRLGFRWQMVARSVWRNWFRTGVGLAAACFGSALMLLAFYFNDAMKYIIDFQFDKVLVSDMDLNFEDVRDHGALLEATRLPGVDHAEPLFVVPVEFRHGHHTKKSAITGLTREARLTVPRDADGDAIPIPDSGLVMSRKLADILDVGLGDEVTIVPIRGRRDPLKVPVTRLTDAFLGISTYADYDYLNRLLGETAAVSSVQLKTARGFEPRLALYRAIKKMPVVKGISDNEQARENLLVTLVEMMRIALVLLVGFAGAIYLGSILTTSFVSIAERRREVATMRVIGYGPGQVGGVFLRESLVVNTAGALLGLPLGYALILLLIEQYNTEMYRIPLLLRPQGIALTVGLGVAFTLLAHGFVQRTINRLDWLDALNAKE